MPTACVSLQVLPTAKDTAHSWAIIDKVIELIERSGVTYEVGPMETTMEGDLDQLLNIVRDAHVLGTAAGASAVFSVVKIIYNPDGVATIADKVGARRGAPTPPESSTGS